MNKEEIIEKIKEELTERFKKTSGEYIGFETELGDKIEDLMDGQADLHEIYYRAEKQGEDRRFYNYTSILFVPDKLLDAIKTKEDLREKFGDIYIGDGSLGKKWADYIYSQSGKRLTEHMSERIGEFVGKIDDDVLKKYIQEKYMLTQQGEQDNFIREGYEVRTNLQRGNTVAIQEYMRKFGNMDPETLDFKKQMTIDYALDKIDNQMDLEGIERGDMNFDKIKYIETNEDGGILMCTPNNTGLYGAIGNCCKIKIDKQGKVNIYGVQTSPELCYGVVNRFF